ncbi:hypothetical protein [Plantibacter sp. LMC-P-059a]|uniref:hypothetical protein n=1 Tax=Plantibacter sp. LMC-P-059a TaxID=3040297 RepID=UPI00254B0492|nr:hypothetical protein [Plantibacter sp. LMC-P-059a]
MGFETEADFWGDQGRLGVIRTGELTDHHLFAYPESVEPWWTVVVETLPEADVPDERFIRGSGSFALLMREWDVEWFPRGRVEQDVESALFGWRPLVGSSWTQASTERARFGNA